MTARQTSVRLAHTFISRCAVATGNQDRTHPTPVAGRLRTEDWTLARSRSPVISLPPTTGRFAHCLEPTEIPTTSCAHVSARAPHQRSRTPNQAGIACLQRLASAFTPLLPRCGSVRSQRRLDDYGIYTSNLHKIAPVTSGDSRPRQTHVGRSLSGHKPHLALRIPGGGAGA